jgi:hypothetical protein
MFSMRFLLVVAVLCGGLVVARAQQVVPVPPIILFTLDTSVWKPIEVPIGVPMEPMVQTEHRKFRGIYISVEGGVGEFSEEEGLFGKTDLKETTLADGMVESTYKSEYAVAGDRVVDVYNWERVRKLPNGYYGIITLWADKENYKRAAKLWKSSTRSIRWVTPEDLDKQMGLPMSAAKYQETLETATQRAVEERFFGNPIETILRGNLDDIRQETAESLEHVRTFSYAGLFKYRESVRAGSASLGEYFERIANYDYNMANYVPTESDYQVGRTVVVSRETKRSFDGTLSFDRTVETDTVTSYWAFGTDTLRDMGYVVVVRMRIADSVWSVKVMEAPISRNSIRDSYFMSDYDLPDNPFVVLREPKGVRYWVGHPNASNLLPLPQSSFVEGQYDVLLTEVQAESRSAIGTFFGKYDKDYTYDEIQRDPELKALIGDEKLTADFYKEMGTTPPASKKGEIEEAERVVLQAVIKKKLRESIDPKRRVYRSSLQVGDINSDGQTDIYLYQVSDEKLVEASGIQLKEGVLEPIQNKRNLGTYVRNTYGFSTMLEQSGYPQLLLLNVQEN